MADISAQLEATRIQLHDSEIANQRDKEDLELYRQKIREDELDDDEDAAVVGEGLVKGSLDEEMIGISSPTETRTE